jgi:hypothetical protein
MARNVVMEQQVTSILSILSKKYPTYKYQTLQIGFIWRLKRSVKGT